METDLVMEMKHIPVDLALITDDEEELEEDQPFSTSELFHTAGQDDISNCLLESGTMNGIAAAAALATSRKRYRPYKFEVNPAQRKRHQTRLLRKLRQTIIELCMRCGQQAVVLSVSSSKDNAGIKVFGSSPLDHVVKRCEESILCGLKKELKTKLPASAQPNSNNLYALPALTVDGIPLSLQQMNQAQLRMFIPEMLKYSTGRGKPGWGKESKKPVWWPQDVPWANVKRDARSPQAKLNVSWTQALRQIVNNCYRYHGREDLLNSSVEELASKQHTLQHSRERVIRSSPVVAPPTLVQTVHNADGSVSLLQLDSGQMIATISRDQTGHTVATLANSDSEDAQMNMAMDEMANASWALADQDNSIADAYSVITSVSGDSAVSKSHDNLLSFATNEQVINAAALTEGVTIATGEETSAMVQIPVSVYEKIAHSIQESGVPSSMSLSANGQLQLQPAIPQDKFPTKTTLKRNNIKSVDNR